MSLVRMRYLAVCVALGAVLAILGVVLVRVSRPIASATNTAAAESPTGELGGVGQGGESVTPEQAVSRASFRLMLPDSSAFPEGASFERGIVQPQSGGEGFAFFYANGIEVSADPVGYRLDLGSLGASETYQPDLRKPDRQALQALYRQVDVNGIPAVAREPFDQVLWDGSTNHVSGLVAFQVPGAKPGEYVNYNIAGEQVPAEVLLKIAKSMK